MAVNEVHPNNWAYVDDRSITAYAPSTNLAVEMVNAKLVRTKHIDHKLGLRENAKKRQRWRDNDKVEHLGIIIALVHPKKT